MSDESQTAVVVKGGVTPIEVSLRRTGVGLEVNVKLLPEVEDFMRTLGAGRTVPVNDYGRHWVPQLKSVPFIAYDLLERIDGEQEMYRIDAIGQPLSYEGYTNLAFLRLVGASEGAGAGFFLKGVYSTQALRTLKESIASSARQFFIEYLRPLDMVVKVSTQEVRLPL